MANGPDHVPQPENSVKTFITIYNENRVQEEFWKKG
jgi:hypothetical protein